MVLQILLSNARAHYTWTPETSACSLLELSSAPPSSCQTQSCNDDDVIIMIGNDGDGNGDDGDGNTENDDENV